MLESTYQARLIPRIRALLPGCIILKNDTDYMQGIPDLTILYKERWAFLEVKKDARASEQPNQSYYIELAQELSFGAFVYPENEREVLDALYSALGDSRQARLSQR